MHISQKATQFLPPTKWKNLWHSYTTEPGYGIWSTHKHTTLYESPLLITHVKHTHLSCVLNAQDFSIFPPFWDCGLWPGWWWWFVISVRLVCHPLDPPKLTAAFLNKLISTSITLLFFYTLSLSLSFLLFSAPEDYWSSFLLLTTSSTQLHL